MDSPQEERQSEISSLWRPLDPANYYDAGEVAILRAYFGLKPRPQDPDLAALYEAAVSPESDSVESCSAGPIRLRAIEHSIGELNDLSHAVARVCLADVQDCLPQWALCRDKGEVLGRRPFAGPDRTFTPLNPRRLLCINWADSGPGFSWPEDYHVTLLPGFGRHVVTASADSLDSYGVLDFAIGWFRASEDIVAGSRRILKRWWRAARGSEGAPWVCLFNEGLIDAAEAYRMRRLVWPTEGTR